MIYKRNKTYHVDVTVNGIRYRESLETRNWQEAQHKQKELIGRILEGKAAPPAGKGSFASLPLEQALDQFVKSREGRVAERTTQIDRERSKVLKRIMGGVLVRKVDAAAIRAYQDARKAEGVSGRTINLEVTLIRQILKRAKRWSIIADDVANLPENQNVVGRALTLEQKLLLFRTAASRPEWDVAYCAGVIAVNTTCRKVELLNLHWSDVDLFGRTLPIQRSKTEAGRRTIPLNDEALAAFARLLRRAEVGGGGAAEHFVFPGCENGALDFTRHQRSLHTAWRSLVKQAGTQAGREAARAVLESGGRIGAAKAAWKGAAQAFRGFRFHDLRHQSITEMAEAGVPDAAIQSIAGHLSKKMQDHYSHVRMAAKRQAVEALGGGLIGLEPDAEHAKGRAN
ncbi:MAG: tyrosine-type recombinase/integrase [Bryobacteraceae bacterium]